MATKKHIPLAQSARDSRHNESKSNQHHPATSVQPVDQDAERTGGSPNRQRGALRGNTEEGAGEQHPDQPAGQHATGSFTGTGGELPGTRKENDEG
ncbi:MAG: hypothetical protein JOZ83_16230 [Silvibacterium sp.]|nr:hypothetical protein [Silvibacterium sp.]